jgi:hypothetical protein
MEADVGILREAQYRQRRDEWGYCVVSEGHLVHASSHGCLGRHTCSGLLSCPLGFVLGRCQSRAHRRLHRSWELAGAGGQGTLVGIHMGRIVLAATEMDDWGVGRTVGRLNSLTWSFRRLLTRLVIGAARWSVGFIERKTSVTALTACTKQRAALTCQVNAGFEELGFKVLSSSSGHYESVEAEGCRKVQIELQAGRGG